MPILTTTISAAPPSYSFRGGLKLGPVWASGGEGSFQWADGSHYTGQFLENNIDGAIAYYPTCARVPVSLVLSLQDNNIILSSGSASEISHMAKKIVPFLQLPKK
eukprot:5512076-Amphidinium_carterae.1